MNEQDKPWRNKSVLRSLHFDRGFSYSDIAEELGCSQSAITRWMKRHGLNQQEPPWESRGKLSTLHLDENRSPEEIAEILDCNEEAVVRRLKKYDLWRGDRPWADPDILRDLYIEEALLTEEIAEKFDCSPDSVSFWLRRHEIEKEEKEKPWRDEKILRELYIEEGMSDKEVADELGCYRDTVSTWLHRNDIEVRGQGGGPWQDEELLRELYIHQNKSVVDISEELGCAHSTVSNWLAKYDIKTRGSSSDHRYLNESVEETDEPFKDPEILEQYYIDEGMSVREVAKELDTVYKVISKYLDKFDLLNSKESREELQIQEETNIPEDSPWKDRDLMKELYKSKGLSTRDIAEVFSCSPTTIRNWLMKHDISIRQRSADRPDVSELYNLYYGESLSVNKISQRLDVAPATVTRWLKEADIEIKDSDALVNEELKDPDVMHEMYVENELSIWEIALKTGSHQGNVKDWLRHHDIELRDLSHELSGKNNGNWKGGQAPYGEGWTKKKREQVYEKYGRYCQSCGMSQEHHEEKYSTRLDVHHIIPARRFDNPKKRNNIDNLVPLCKKCHKKWEGIPLRPEFAIE